MSREVVLCFSDIYQVVGCEYEDSSSGRSSVVWSAEGDVKGVTKGFRSKL
jgi:hypothetical protein